jgi:hypothetical protein
MQEFVAGGGIDFTDFEIPDHEVTYRRAEFGTAFTTTSRFESLVRFKSGRLQQGQNGLTTLFFLIMDDAIWGIFAGMIDG